MTSTHGNTLPQSVGGTCFNAQTYLGYEDEYGNGTQLNADLGGAIIACSYIAINALLPFLFVWSKNVTSHIFLLFSQTIPILIATLSSVSSNNLSLFDAHFAVAVTGSPMSFYIAVSCIRYPFRREKEKQPRLFKKIPSDEAKSLICIMGGLLLPCLWLSVSLITSFSSTAFRNSFYCEGVTLPRYLEFLAVSSFTGVLDIMGRRDLADDFSRRWGLGFFSLLFMLNWAVYLVHHREEILQKCMAPIKELTRRGGGAKVQHLRVAKEYIILLWRIPKLSWTTITSYHPSMVAWLLLSLHWGWALGIANALTFDRTQLRSYGQVLSLFVPIPAMWSFGKILRDHRTTILHSIKATPVFVREGVCFAFIGRNKWDTPPTERDYFKWSRLKWVVVLWSALAYLGLHAVWITFYVRAGSMPNNRNKVNNPHKGWKPYSVCLYINGYCCSVVCIFLAVAFFDFLSKWQTNNAAFPSSRPCPSGPPVHLCADNRLSRGRKARLSRHQDILQKTIFVFSVFLAMLLCVSPIFVPFLALPMAQEWHWKHDCDPYPVEIILHGQPSSFQEASISIYASRRYAPGDLYPFQRTWMHKYKFYSPDKNHPSVRIMEYVESVRQLSTVNGSFLSVPKAKTLLLDTERREFLGCSDRSEDALGSGPNVTANMFGGITISLASCTEGSGTYETSPYLRFAIRYPTLLPTSVVYLQAESKEWAFFNDAPAVALRYTDSVGTNLRDLSQRPRPFVTALTKRNHPAVLKVCAEDVDVSVEVLGPLGVMMDALNRFAIYISRPRVLSDA